MQYKTVEESRSANIAYHLAPGELWERQRTAGSYVPEAFEQDGFIHATNGTDRLLWVANEFYKGDGRPYTVLVIDLTKLSSPVRYDDPEEAYPHIYGPLNADAVVGELVVQRAADGSFVAVGDGGS